MIISKKNSWKCFIFGMLITPNPLSGTKRRISFASGFRREAFLLFSMASHAHVCAKPFLRCIISPWCFFSFSLSQVLLAKTVLGPGRRECRVEEVGVTVRPLLSRLFPRWNIGKQFQAFATVFLASTFCSPFCSSMRNVLVCCLVRASSTPFDPLPLAFERGLSSMCFFFLSFWYFFFFLFYRTALEAGRLVRLRMFKTVSTAVSTAAFDVLLM